MRLRFIIVTAAVLLAMSAAPAFAYHEPFVAGTDCGACHNDDTWAQQPTCVDCHDLDPDPNMGEYYGPDHFPEGPHSRYATTTGKCDNCHSVHDASAEGIALLPGPTIWATCLTCHDGTGGFGVYGAVLAQTGIDPFDDDPDTPGGGHLFASTTWVPGGSASTGGGETRSFNGVGGQLTCSDCHSVHGANVVDPFVGDRRRLRANQPSQYSTKLLRQRPTTSEITTTRYGSDWCLGCHSGRNNMAPLHNHPVDAVASDWPAAGAPWDYGNIPILASDGVTGSLVLSGMGGVIKTGSPSAFHQPDPPYASENRGYLMLYPRIGDQIGHAPICQQCHEDSRSVGTLLGTGATADAADAVITPGSADGVIPTDNPRFQNFPHETQNTYLLVETGDDLCLNCHPMTD